jgi:hypothetical protein
MADLRGFFGSPSSSGYGSAPPEAYVGSQKAPLWTLGPGGQPIPSGTTFDKVGKGSGAYDWSINNIIKYGTANVGYLQGEENRRQDMATGIVSGASAAAQNPLLTQEQIDSQFGAGADAAAPNYLNQMQNLRDSLGGAGISGGQYGAAMASNYGLQRMGQVTDARRSTMLDSIRMNAALKAQNFQTSLAEAAQVGKGPSMLGQDWIGQMLGLRLNQYGAAESKQAAEKASNAAMIGGALGGFGSLAGGFMARKP